MARALEGQHWAAAKFNGTDGKQEEKAIGRFSPKAHTVQKAIPEYAHTHKSYHERSTDLVYWEFNAHYSNDGQTRASKILEGRNAFFSCRSWSF